MVGVPGHRKSPGSALFNGANHLFLVLVAVVMLYPLLRVMALSVSDPSFISAGKVNWYPQGFNVIGYQLIFKDPDLLITYKNTLLYAAVGTFLTLLLTSLIAYPLALREFILRKQITIFLAITLFFSGGLIPTFLVIKTLGLLNTFWVMVLPTTIVAFNVIMFRTFFQTIPGELRDSAAIDGANDVVILFRIIMPLSKALLAVFALFSIVGHWNSWFPALIYLRDSGRWPVQMLLRRLIIIEDFFQTGWQDDVVEYYDKMRRGLVHPKNVQMAVIFVTMAPILCVYPFVQRYFVKGVMIGSLKG